jgi:hypothetical protein
MRKRKVLEELDKWKVNSKNIRFEKLCAIAEAFGFRFSRGKGSHKVYVRYGVREILNFQEVDGRAKSYQVKQFIEIIERYDLIDLLEDDDDV